MKTITTVLTCICAILTSMSSFANDEKFIQAMQKSIQTVYTAATEDDLQTAVNAFDRIAAAEPNRWEPHYYAAFANLMICARVKEGSAKDSRIDLALASIEKAKKIENANTAEIAALEGFAYMMRVTVDPASRGAQFSGLAVQQYQKALTIQPNNPRALALLAQMQYGTAQFFGSSTAEACETLKKAVVSFDTFKPDQALAPMWGLQMALSLQKNCQ